MVSSKQPSRILALALAVLLWAAMGMQAAAQTGTDTAGFTVQAVIPGNQIDKNATYFDLRVEPGASQVLQVALSNNSDSDMIIDVDLNAASTNRNGIIEYQVADETDDSMRYPFHVIADTEREIHLKAGGKHMAEILLKMPEASFDGTILGGIVFTRRAEETRGTVTGINNQFSYVIGVKLTESSEAVEPDFNLQSVEETLINYRAAVVANIQNPQPLIVQNAETSAQIYKGNATEPLFSTVKHDVSIAPNSVFPLPVEWDGNRMDPGDYRIAVKLVHQDKEWIWDEAFQITSGGAQTINDNALVPLADRPGGMQWWHWLLILLAIGLILWLAFYLGRKSKRDEPREQP